MCAFILPLTRTRKSNKWTDAFNIVILNIYWDRQRGRPIDGQAESYENDAAIIVIGNGIRKKSRTNTEGGRKKRKNRKEWKKKERGKRKMDGNKYRRRIIFE